MRNDRHISATCPPTGPRSLADEVKARQRGARRNGAQRVATRPGLVHSHPEGLEGCLIGLLQRVSQASVVVEGQTIAAIDLGLLVMVGIEREDRGAQAERLLERLLAYRVFPDQRGRMNLDVREAGGSLLLVPQFTLPADTRKGNRPGFSAAADPMLGQALFERLVGLGRTAAVPVLAGRFGATMQVNLSNEGPVTFWLRVPAGV